LTDAVKSGAEELRLGDYAFMAGAGKGVFPAERAGFGGGGKGRGAGFWGGGGKKIGSVAPPPPPRPSPCLSHRPAPCLDLGRRHWVAGAASSIATCTASAPRQASRLRWPATWIAAPRVSARNWPSGVPATRKAIARNRTSSSGSAKVQRRWPLPTASAWA